MKLTLLFRRLVDGSVIVLLAITVWRVVGGTRPPFEQPSEVLALTPAVKTGDVLRLAGLAWSRPRTVLLVVSSTCPACNANLPFYRQLAAAATAQVQVIAVSSQPEAVVAEWLRQNRVEVSSTHTIANPLAYGLTLTPMVLMLDVQGRVTDVMIRKLDEPDQARVLERMQSLTSTALDNSHQIRELSVNELDVIPANRRVQILDVRSRDRFQGGHRHHARNIPSPELRARAAAELDARVPVIVDCLQPGAATTCRSAAWSLIDADFNDVSILIR